jgi:hypothetical protein
MRFVLGLLEKLGCERTAAERLDSLIRGAPGGIRISAKED